jgi:hypothetical protein
LRDIAKDKGQFSAAINADPKRGELRHAVRLPLRSMSATGTWRTTSAAQRIRQLS